MLTLDGTRALVHRHQWLYHTVVRPDARSRETIASDGLTPGHSRRRWHDLFTPRRGHVYLSVHSYLTEWWMQVPGVGVDFYAVDTRCLVPARLNPDEDHFTANKVAACDRFHLPPAADLDLWRVFGSNVVPSYGEWAEQVELGSDPVHTAYSLSQGSVAYAGVIPPTSLLRWDKDRRTWYMLPGVRFAAA